MMDSQYIKENDVIERYLLKQLSDEELQGFRVALLFNKDLQKKVEDTRLLHQYVQLLKLKNSEQPINTKSNQRNIIWWLIGSLLLISIAAVGYFASTNSLVKKQENTPTTIGTPQKATEPVTDELPKIEETEEENQPAFEPFVPEKKVTTPKKSSQPIAVADIKTHPYLDQFTTGGFRNNDIKITVNSPKMGETLALENGKINLNIKSVLSINEMPGNERFVVRLFSNKKADFDDFKPILSANPNIRKSGNEYQLSLNANIPLSIGLYYFIIEDNGIEDMIYVGKFLVE